STSKHSDRRSSNSRAASAALVAEGDSLNELLVRIISGLVMIGVALAAAFEGGDFFALLVAAVATAMFWEWWTLTRSWGPRWTVGGFVYALLPAISLLWIRERDADGVDLLLWVFIVTWATDIGAYFVGRAIGRTKLAPSISPGKTVEGLAGGVIAAALLGGGWVVYSHLGRNLFILAPLFALAAQGG